jgi:hypothetical protein
VWWKQKILPADPTFSRIPGSWDNNAANLFVVLAILIVATAGVSGIDHSTAGTA